MKDNNPIISIILPIRNEEDTISLVIDSIISQTKYLDEIEVIIADGLSNDRTKAIIKRYQKDYSFIFIVDNKLKFVSHGFNLALSQARGKFIIRIDGHCEVPPNYLEYCIKLLNITDADIVGGAIETVANGTVGKAISCAQSSIFGVGSVEFRDKKNMKSSYVQTLAFGAHKRDVFLQIGGYDEDMICNQDDEFNFRAIQNGKKIWMDAKLKTKYYSRSNFHQLFKQYFNYGFYKVRGIQKRNQIFSLRHLVPSIFILSLAIASIFGLLIDNLIVAFLIIGCYIIFNIIFSIISSSKIYLVPLIFLSFGILHLAYGFGFYWGLVRFINKFKNNSVNDRGFSKEKFLLNT